jgi:hypothetical protein
MFEVVVTSGAILHAFKVGTLKEALGVQFVYRKMGLAARIWRVWPTSEKT